MAVEDGFYTETQRQLQAEHDATKLADTVRNAIVWDVIEGPNVDFIESRDFFFLSTVDDQGRPTVSYKGGPPGFCRVVDDKSLVFPAYDGNGMFKSLGNIVDTARVGLLFIDFETPNRVRVQGEASFSGDDSELSRYPGAIGIVRVAVESCFLNCARYIHKHQRIEASPYVPDGEGQQPHPSWKRIDFVQDALSEADRARTSATGGQITMDDYVDHLMKGES
jgi:hypothetical protein